MDTGLAPCLRQPAPLCAEILNGLSAPQKRLPPKLFYDERGSQLFDAICDLPEYYIPRTEQSIMQQNIGAICRALGPQVRLVELGSGSSVKTRLLLDHLERPHYIPVDISHQHLQRTAAALRQAYPDLPVQPVTADFSTDFQLPETDGAARTVVYFPGSTLGNFEPRQARALLRRIRGMVGRGGGLLLGVDLRKDTAVLEAAYNDAAGVTAAFNLNMLQRLNREFDADFELSAFRHRAHYDGLRGRIEMHLISDSRQSFSIFGQRFLLRPGETLHTENSYKHSLTGLSRLAAATGFDIVAGWTDHLQYFAVQWWQVPE
jgi:dimethylhistidine N-methyltransferase